MKESSLQSARSGGLGQPKTATSVDTLQDALATADQLSQHVNQFLNDLLRNEEVLEGYYCATDAEALFPRLANRAYETRRKALNAIDRIANARAELGL